MEILYGRVMGIVEIKYLITSERSLAHQKNSTCEQRALLALENDLQVLHLLHAEWIHLFFGVANIDFPSAKNVKKNLDIHNIKLRSETPPIKAFSLICYTIFYICVLNLFDEQNRLRSISFSWIFKILYTIFSQTKA